MDADHLIATLDALGRPRVLVVGDLILDRYCWGDAERISPEAPVVVLQSDAREVRLGGAANVCQMVAGLEADVTAAGIVGTDDDGRELRSLLADHDIDPAFVVEDAHRPTTVKERFMGRAAGRHPHQILRVDREDRSPLASDFATAWCERIEMRLDDFDVVLVSDYAKGVCTPEVVRRLITAARRKGVPIVVDPCRGGDYAPYRGATTLTPNRTEAELATGRTIRTTDEALAAADQLKQDLELQLSIVTLDRDGIALVPAEGPGALFGTQVQQVYDITGAGDVVLSVIGVSLAAGVAAADAVKLANIAAGLEVEQVGVAVVKRDEIRHRLMSEAGRSRSKVVSLNQLAQTLERHRQQGEKVALTNGCFDLLHVGHVTYLEAAAKLGDVFVVAVNSDAGVRRLKGPLRPVIGEQDRAAMLSALSCVDYVLVFDEDTPHAVLHRLRPDVLVKGGTYTTDEVVGREVVEAYGGGVHVTGCIDGVSTTEILRSVAEARRPPHAA